MTARHALTLAEAAWSDGMRRLTDPALAHSLRRTLRRWDLLTGDPRGLRQPYGHAVIQGILDLYAIRMSERDFLRHAARQILADNEGVEVADLPPTPSRSDFDEGEEIDVGSRFVEDMFVELLDRASRACTREGLHDTSAALRMLGLAAREILPKLAPPVEGDRDGR